MVQPTAPSVGIVDQPAPLRPDFTAANAIASFGKLAGQQVKAVQTARLEANVNDTAEAAKTVNDITQSLTTQGASQDQINHALDVATSFDPNAVGPSQLEGLDLPDNVKQKIMQVKANASSQFNTIAEAVRQGAMSKDAAALQLEATTRKLVNETPGFGPEIKQLARALTGYDPTNFDLQQVLNINAKKAAVPLTETQKMGQQADAIVAGLAAAGRHVDKATVMGNLALAKFNQAQNDALKAQLSNNDINFQSYVHQSVASRGPDLSGTLMRIAAIPQEKGGITDPQTYVNTIIQQREADKTQLRQTAATYAQGVSNDQISAAMDQVDKAYQPLIDAVKENGLGTLLDSRLKTIAKLNQAWGAQTLPKLTRLVQAFPGSQIPNQLLTMMANTADPNQFKLLTSFDPGIKAMVDQGLETPASVSSKLSDVTFKVLTGQQLSSDDLKFEPLAERVVLQTPNSNETRQKFIDGLGTQAPIRATSLLATSVPRPQATNKEVQFMKRQYKMYVGRPDGSPEPTLVDQVAHDIPSFALDTIKVEMQPRSVKSTDAQGNTGWITKQVPVITFDDRPAPVRTKGAYVNLNVPDSLKKLQVFVNAVENGYGKDFGVDPGTFAQNLVSRIKQQMEVQDHLNFSGKIQRGGQ